MTGKEQQELSFDKEQNHGKEQQELTSDKGQDLSKMTGKEEEELTFDKEQYSSFGNYSVFLKHVKQSIKQTPKDGCSIQVPVQLTALSLYPPGTNTALSLYPPGTNTAHYTLTALYNLT